MPSRGSWTRGSQTHRDYNITVRPLTLRRLATLWILAIGGIGFVGLIGIAVGNDALRWPSGFVLDFRLSRVASAGLVGAALAAAGVGYQAVLRNPLAEPYLLGVSGGAALAAFAWSLPTMMLPDWLGLIGRDVAAFIGAMIAVGIVLTLAGGRGRLDPARAILVGVVVSILCGGLFALLVQLTREPGGGAFAFLFGRIDGLQGTRLLVLTCIVLLGILSLAALAGQLGGLATGDDEAAASGVAVERTRWIVLVLASLLAAVATAASGPIGFVGLMGPHLARLLVGVDPRRVLPVGVAIGAALVILADAIGRRSIGLTGSEVPAGIVTNLIGGPFFLLLLYGRRGKVAT